MLATGRQSSANFRGKVDAISQGKQCQCCFSFVYRRPACRVFYNVSELGDSPGACCAADSTLWTVQVLARWTEEYGQVYKFEIAGDAVLVVTDPEVVINLCSNSNKQDNLPKFWKAYLSVETVSHYTPSEIAICSD